MSVDKITREELIQRIRDPNFDLTDLSDYITINHDSTRGIKVEAVDENLKIAKDKDNPLTEANVAFDWIIKAIRSRRKDIFDSRLQKKPADSIVLLDGDSWAQHPFVKEIYEQLTVRYNVYCSSLAGRTMQELHDENRYIEMIQDMQDLDLLDNIKAIVLSGGGNDLFGSELREIIKDFDSAHPDDPEAHIDLTRCKKLLDDVVILYSRVIKKIRSSFPDFTAPIIMHSYSYLCPWDSDGLIPKDKWIGDPMRAKGIVDQELQKKIVEVMVDLFHDRLRTLVSDTEILLDNRTFVPLDEHMWSDEIHPSSAGFKLVGSKIKAAISPN